MNEKQEMLYAKLREKLDEFNNDRRKIGLYVVDGGINIPQMSDEEKNSLTEPVPDAILTVVFTIGDVAYSERIQNPVQDQVNEEARAMLPTEAEMMQERLRQAIAEGKNPFDLDLKDQTES